LTWLVGKPLIQANADLRAREAEFRFLLVRVDDAAEAVAIHRGEQDERRGLREAAGKTFAIMGEIAGGLARLTWITAGYGWMAIIAPIVVAAPGYFQGGLTFGGLMMVAGAFTQVQQSLRWFVDRFAALAEWRVSLHRAISYRDALIDLEHLEGSPDLISYSDHPEGKLALIGLRVFAPNGEVFLPEASLEVAPGERLLIVGTPRCGKSTFFRALAGLWVWGKGSIWLPKSGTVAFLPHRPYIPVGTLTLDEQQRIALVRVLLHQPDWIIQDGALSELDDDNRRLAESLFHKELAQAALISIGRKSGNGHFYHRTIELQVAPLKSRLFRDSAEPATVAAA
jgi:vitamin B12/bleomycin/antimicrobial peptide transport system ATP-binding/permease protein